MNKLIRYIQAYLLFSLPFIFTDFAFSLFFPKTELTYFVQQIIGWNIVPWFFVLIVFLIMLVVIPQAREMTLRRLANIKERDEREEYITGKASRVTYISTLSLLILLLFFSMFSITVERLPKTQNLKSPHHALKLGFKFSPFEDLQSFANKSKNNIIFGYEKITLSKSSLLLILLIWQLVIFNLSARKEQKSGC